MIKAILIAMSMKVRLFLSMISRLCIVVVSNTKLENLMI